MLAILILVFWLVPLDSFGQSKSNRKTVIVIDPGHGGTDSGAIGTNGIQEKDIVFKIAREMVRLNKSLFGNSDGMYLTRDADTLVSLGDRTKLAAKLNADLFISLHCNHSGNPSAKGVEFYVPKNGEHLRESIHLAYKLQTGMRQNIGLWGRGVKFADFQVLRETVDYCPTVLVELGFLSHLDEAQYLTEDENEVALALSLVSGLKVEK